MPPAAPQTVRSVETASALYVGSPAAPPSATQYRDAADSAASSDDEAFDDDGWVPVPQDLVHTWRTVAITGAALRGSSSLDLATAAASAAPSLAAKMSAMRVVASCNNLPSLLAPPPVPAPKPPLLVVPAPPSASSGASSVRCAAAPGAECTACQDATARPCSRRQRNVGARARLPFAVARTLFGTGTKGSGRAVAFRLS